MDNTKTRKYRKHKGGRPTTRKDNHFRYKTGFRSSGTYNDDYYYSFKKPPELWKNRIKRHCGEPIETDTYENCMHEYGNNLITHELFLIRKKEYEEKIKRTPRMKHWHMLEYVKQEMQYDTDKLLLISILDEIITNAKELYKNEALYLKSIVKSKLSTIHE